MTRAWPRLLRGGGLAALAGAGLCAAWLFSGSVDAAALDPSGGGPTRVTDRHGTLLRAVPSPGGRPGRDAWVPLDRVPSIAVLTLLAGEDKRFFEHHGADLAAVGRALWLNLRSAVGLDAGGARYGASTLTMQLARMLVSQGAPRTYGRKLAEARLALALERALTKNEILEQYLNRAYFGHGAYGIEGAAETYFGKPAASLSAAEATALLVLVRGPAHYDPLRHPERLRARRAHLLGLLEARGHLTREERAHIEEEPLHVALRERPFLAPHFVDHVLSVLPARRPSGEVVTTLDLPLEARLEARLRDYVREQARHGVTDAALVVLTGDTAEVLAMVGSRDYGAARMNLATWRRSPGSALKPFVYAADIARGASPATVAFDVREVVPGMRIDGFPVERGPVRYREALAGSLNFAAMDVISRVGVDVAAETLRRAGVGELPQSGRDYGERLALGATRVRLVELAAGYRAFVHGGRVLAPRVLGRVALGDAERREEVEVFDPVTAYLVMDMLSDPEARRPVFGDELAVDLPYRVVAKTGTARGFSDTVSVIATKELIVAAWVGRTDGGATEGRLGMQTAAPLARDALLIASRGRMLTLPEEPAGVAHAAVCALSGQRPGAHCPHTKQERFRSGTEPTATCDWHGPGGALRLPPELHAWRAREPRTLAQRAQGDTLLLHDM